MDNLEPILKELMSGDFEKNVLKEIKQMLDEECAKPIAARDYDKIAELTKSYSEISGTENFVQEATAQGIQKLAEQTPKPRIRMTKRFKIMIAAGCAALVLLAANAFTVSAWDMNVFTAIIHFSKDGFSVDFPEQEAVVLPTNEDDPYGIKGECAKYGLEVEAPTYLPEGFVLQTADNRITDNFENTMTFFFYRNGHEVIAIYYTLFDSRFVHSSIPSDDFNLSEISVNGKAAVVSKEDGQYNIIWADGNLETVIHTQNLDYSECDRIVTSLK